MNHEEQKPQPQRQKLERAQAQVQQQQPPQTLIGAGGQVAGSVVSTLGTQPILLVIVLLNAVMAGAASWYLSTQEGYRHAERLKSITLFERCVSMGVATPTYGPGSGARPVPPAP